MGIFGNLFGGVFNVERDRNGNTTYFLKGEGFENSKDYLKKAIENPVLMTVLAMRCKLFSQMKITHLNKDGEVIENSEYIKLLQTPNYFQSQEDFLFQLMWFQSAVGTNLSYQIKPFSTSVPKAIYNLIPSEIDLKKTQEIKKFIALDKDKKDYENQSIVYKLDGQAHNLKLADLIPFYDLSNGLKPNTFNQSPSRVSGISKTLENIEQNLKSKNINLQMSQKYLAGNKTTINGVTPQVTSGDRTIIERILGSKSLHVTNQNIDVKHLVSDFKKLFLDEMFSADALTCLLAFEMNKDMLNYFSNGASTYENFNQSLISFIQNSTQTDANSTLNSFSQQWGLFEKGERLVASYDHLPIMQKVMNEKIDTLVKFLDTITKEKELGSLTDTEAKKKIQAMKQTLNL